MKSNVFTNWPTYLHPLFIYVSMHKHNVFFATKLWLCNNVYFLFREMSLRFFCFFNAEILSEFSSFLCFCFSTLPSLLTYCSLVNWVFIHISQLQITKKTRDCCAKFATGLCIIVKSAFLFNFLTKFDYKHLK